MNARPMPPAEVDVSLGLVRRLIAGQMPDLADRPLRMLAHGWDNVMVGLGDDLVARLPRRAVAVDLLLHEQRWLPPICRLPGCFCPPTAAAHSGTPMLRPAGTRLVTACGSVHVAGLSCCLSPSSVNPPTTP